MSSNWSKLSLISSVCAAVLACREPGAPLPLLADVEGTAGELLGSGGKAGGRADVHGTPVQNVLDETYSFTAVSTDAPPFAKGEVEVHLLRFTGQELVVHAEVTCVSIVGNEAWVGSRVRRFSVNREEVPQLVDRPMIFRVRDVGEGEGTVDLASLVFFPPTAEGDLEHCNARPDFPILRESGTGNIQVNP